MIAVLFMAHIQLPSLHISITFICILSVQISNPAHIGASTLWLSSLLCFNIGFLKKVDEQY